jgi:hypothetical protein
VGGALEAAVATEAEANLGEFGAARWFVSDNYLLFSVFALLAATCWQIDSIQIGLGIGGFFALVSILIGVVLWKRGLRKVWKESLLVSSVAYHIQSQVVHCFTPQATDKLLPTSSLSPPPVTQTPVYYFEVIMCVTFIVLWGCTFPTAQGGGPSETEYLIQDYLNFIIFSIFGGLALVR